MQGTPDRDLFLSISGICWYVSRVRIICYDVLPCPEWQQCSCMHARSPRIMHQRFRYKSLLWIWLQNKTNMELYPLFDIVCKFWLEFANNLKIKPKSTKEKYGVCIRPSKNVFCWLYIYICIYVYMIYIYIYMYVWFPTWKSIWMIPTEAPTGRKLGLQAVRVSANPISLGMEISWDISWDFFGHPNR